MNIDEFRKRTRRLLPKSQELDLWVLKGQILIEEQLNRLIEQGMCEKEILKDARLTSHQKLKIAQAMMGRSAFERIWNFVQNLNALRNKLAHKAEIKNFAASVDEAMKPFMSPRFVKSRTKKDRVERLEFCISIALGTLSGIEETHDRIFSKPGALLAWNTAVYKDEVIEKC